MSSATSRPEPTTPEQQVEHAQHYLRVVHRLIDLGANLAERIQDQPVNHAEAVAAGIEPTPQSAAAAVSLAFDRVARCVRRSILLAQHIQNPAPPRTAADPAQHRTLARQRILRVVEDEIHDKYRDEEAHDLREELLERLESVELEDEIGTRPIDDIITDIRRDLDIAGTPGYHHPWKRRTPEDVADLHARAAQPVGEKRPVRTRLGPFVPSVVGAGKPPPLDLDEAIASLLKGTARLPGG